MVIHGHGSGCLSHTGGGALVLHDVGITLNRRDAALHLEMELVGANLRLGELETNGGFNLRVREAHGRRGRWRRSALVKRRWRRVLLSGHRKDYRKQRKRRGEWIVSHSKEVGGHADFLTNSVLE